MEIFILFCCFFMWCSSYILKKDIVHPAFLFSFYWFIILSLAFLQLRGYFTATVFTKILYLIGIVSFFLGSLLVGKKSISIKQSVNSFTRTTILKYRLIYLICFFVLSYSFTKFLRVLPFYLQGYSLAEVRQLYWQPGGGITTGPADYFVDNVLNKGLLLTVIFIVCAEIANGNRNRILISSLIFSVILTAAISGSRLVFFDFLISLFMALLIFNKKIHISKKIKKIIFTIGMLAVLAMVYITIQRQGSEGFLNALYGNFTLNVALMNQVVQKVNSFGDLTYGVIFFRGLIEPVTTILQSFNIIHSSPQSFSILSKYTVPFYNIGGGNYANAYTSTFFYFYLDGRIIGVILGSIIFGALCTIYYNQMKRNINTRNVAIYLLFIDTIFRSNISFSLSVSSYILALIIIPFIYKLKEV